MEKERFFKNAEMFDRIAQRVIPQYDFLQDEVIRFLDYPKEKNLTIVDLGAGSGIFLEKFLLTFPNSKCYWVDYSPDFLRVAMQRLERFGERVHYLLSAIENKWEKLIKVSPDLVISMLTIHHLEDPDKWSLYDKCYKMLNQNGWFMNIDEMKTLNRQGYLNSLAFKEKFALRAGESMDPCDAPYYQVFLEQFNNSRAWDKNDPGIPRQKGDDLHASFYEQVSWLNEIGYRNTDLIIKYHLLHVIAGQK